VFFILRFAIVLGLSICLLTAGYAQETAFKKSLNQEEIETFKEEMVFKYRLFFESVLNIIDGDNNIFSRRNAYYLIHSLFDNEEASISDYLDNKYPETLTLKDYGQRLFLLENVLPLLDKRYKFSDSIYVKPTVKNIDPKYNRLQKSLQNGKLYQVYEGEVFFIEEIISVQKVRTGVFDAVDRNVVKKLSFKIAHDEDDRYRLYITAISIMDPRNRAYDYKEIKEEVRSSEQAWSDSADPDYFREIEQEALARGITLVRDNKVDYEGLSEDKSNWYYDSPSFWDYAIPGYGHLRFGPDKVRYRDAFIHFATTIGTAGLAFHFDRKSSSRRALYETNRSSELAEGYLLDAERFEKRSRVFSVAAIVSYVVDIIHLSNKNNKQKNLIQKVIGASNFNVSTDIYGTRSQCSLAFKF